MLAVAVGFAAQPRPDPAAVRRRAEALLGGASPPGVSPPGGWPPGRDGVVRGSGPPGAGAGPSASGAGGGEPPVGEAEGQAVVGRWPAVRERLPVWVQARCGVEPRAVAAVGVVLAVAVGFAAQQYWSARPQPVTAPAVLAPAPQATPSPPLSPVAGAGPGGPGGRIVVDVGGKVREPGVLRLPGGSRVEDALAAAGGVRPGTDTTGLNRARVLVDGEQVLVGVGAPPAPGGGGFGGGAGPGPLSLGSATAEQLDGLPGVGPVLARHIVEFRTARGGFRAVEDLRQVDGIGERRFAELRKLVRL
ncbi:helix-hairpin-helix domain-containing protein [Streptomyces sp. NPDC058157]|uniref:helix-hairpin-helix domain-containing protein n=1 Tax=Streptomyces sp. NPDC058157 TaxID=3346360 RepID=UPI0036EF361E